MDTFARLAAAIDTALGKYRHSDLADKELTVQILLAVADQNIAFYLDPEEQ